MFVTLHLLGDEVGSAFVEAAALELAAAGFPLVSVDVALELALFLRQYARRVWKGMVTHFNILLPPFVDLGVS